MGIIAAKKRQREAAAAEAARMNENETLASTAPNCADLPSKKQRVDLAADEDARSEDLAVAPGGAPGSTVTSAAAAASSTEHVPDEVPARIELKQYASASELLAACGADAIKRELAQMGLKCGGTPEARAERLWSTKGKALSDLDPRMFAKKSTGFKRQ